MFVIVDFRCCLTKKTSTSAMQGMHSLILFYTIISIDIYTQEYDQGACFCAVLLAAWLSFLLACLVGNTTLPTSMLKYTPQGYQQ